MSDTSQRVSGIIVQEIPEQLVGHGNGICVDHPSTTCNLLYKSQIANITSSKIESQTSLGPFTLPSIQNINSLGLYITVTEEDIVDPTKEFYIEDGEVVYKDKYRFRKTESLPSIKIIFQGSGSYTLPIKRENGVFGSQYFNIPVHDYKDPETNILSFNQVYIQITPANGCSIQITFGRLYWGYSKVISGDIRHNMYTDRIEGNGVIELNHRFFTPADEALYLGYFTTVVTGLSNTIVEESVPSWFPPFGTLGEYFYVRRQTYPTQHYFNNIYTMIDYGAGPFWRGSLTTFPFPNDIRSISYLITSFYDPAVISISASGELKIEGVKTNVTLFSNNIHHGLNKCTHILSDSDTSNINVESIKVIISISSTNNDIRDQYLYINDMSLRVKNNEGDGPIQNTGGLVAASSDCYLCKIDTKYPFDIDCSIGTYIFPPEHQEYTYLSINVFMRYEFTDINYVSIGDLMLYGMRQYGDYVFVKYERGPGISEQAVKDRLTQLVYDIFKPYVGVDIHIRMRIYAYGKIVYEFEYKGIAKYPGYSSDPYGTLPTKQHLNFVKKTDISVEFEVINYNRDYVVRTASATFFSNHYPDQDVSIVDYTALDKFLIRMRCLRYGLYPGGGRTVWIEEVKSFTRGGAFHVKVADLFNIYIESNWAVSKAFIVIVPINYAFDPYGSINQFIVATVPFTSEENLNNRYPSKKLEFIISSNKFVGARKIGVVFENDAGRGIMYVNDKEGNPVSFNVHESPSSTTISLHTCYGDEPISPISHPLVVGQTIYIIKDEKASIHLLHILSTSTYDSECGEYPLFKNNVYNRLIMPASNLETFTIKTPGTFNVRYMLDGDTDSYRMISDQLIVEGPKPAHPGHINFPRRLTLFEDNYALYNFENSELYGKKAEFFDYVEVIHPLGYCAYLPGVFYSSWRFITYEQWLEYENNPDAVYRGEFNSIMELSGGVPGAPNHYAMIVENTAIYVHNGTGWVEGDIPDDDPDNEGKKTIILDLEPVYSDVSDDCPCIKYTTDYTIDFWRIPKLLGTFANIEDLESAHPTGNDMEYALINKVVYRPQDIGGTMQWVPGTIPERIHIINDHVTIPEYGSNHDSWAIQYENNRYYILTIDEPGLYEVIYNGTGLNDKTSELTFQVETSIDD